MNILLMALMMAASGEVPKEVPKELTPKIDMQLQRDYFQAYLLFISAQQQVKVFEDRMQIQCGEKFILNKTLEKQRGQQTASVPECINTVAPTTITPGKPEMKAPEGNKEGK